MAKVLKNLYLSAIHQHAGKTTVALGLYKMFKERKLKTAFMKPVGQKYMTVKNLHVDKDSYLMGEIYHCGRFKEMSPVTVGRGFTEKYIFHPTKGVLQKQIGGAFAALRKNKDVIIVEGTGHAGVGSVIDFSNADVAGMLGSKVLIISEGGIGKSIDEIMLNKALFDLKGVETLGVIVNKVLPEKYKKIKKNVYQGLKNKKIRLFGVIPDEPLLSFPTVDQVMKQLGLSLLCGRKNLSIRVEDTIVAAMEPYNMISYIREGTLVLTSGDRVDNILVAISSHLLSSGKKFQVAGIILTGSLIPHPRIVDLLRRSKIPVLLSDDDTYTVAAKIKAMTCKIEISDKDKIRKATELVRKYVDVDAILQHA